MPSDAPAAKMQAVRDMGAEIVPYDRDTQNSADVVARIMDETGRVEVPPSAHRQVLAGAGTAALEILEDAGGPLDAVLVPCGGGGLTAATAALMAEASPATQVFSAEPTLFDDTSGHLKPDIASPTRRAAAPSAMRS
jgi:threonine dehydratase